MPDQHTDLIVALDFSRPDRAWEWVETLKGLPVIYKVGFELFMTGGPDLVRALVHCGNRVFLDLKFHDIPNTVAKAVQQAALLQVEMFSLHLAGGSLMVKAAVKELEGIPELRPKILGVSVLTSFDDVRWAEVTKAITGHAVEVSQSVDGLIEHAPAWGVDGVVCSAFEVAAIRKVFPSLYTVVPGIRPEGFSAHDQARVMTPSQARAAGASAIVMGRPVIEAADPRKVVEEVLSGITSSKSA
ncbi:orotidine-5'-phosphate decarboxylase [Bdellovibrionota bacterium FG-1]